MTTPLTPAGQAPENVDAWADAYLDSISVMTAGRLREKWPASVAAIERQAADRALAELRREVEGVTLYDGFAETRADAAESIRGRVLALIDKASKPEEGL